MTKKKGTKIYNNNCLHDNHLVTIVTDSACDFQWEILIARLYRQVTVYVQVK